MNTKPRTALIIGGGLTGPAAGMALRKAGLEATVYEAYDTPADNLGGGFTIATNGLDALAALEALDAIAGLGLPAPAIAMYNGRGRLLGTVQTGLPGPGGPDSTSFKRRDMFRVMREEAERRGVRTVFGKRLTGLTENADSITARFADGTEAAADILIGADGIHSTVRRIIDPGAPAPRYTGLLPFGGFAPNPGLAPEPGVWKFAFGRRAFMGWFVPDAEQVWWFIAVPSATPLSRRQILDEGVAAWAERLIALFEGEDVPAAEIVRTQGDGVIVVGAEHDLPNVPVWHRGRAVIIGDAAHAASTSSGQGGSMALEDAVTLGRCLRDCPDHVSAFTMLHELRRDRVGKVIALGAKTASSKAAGPLAARLRDLFMTVGFRYFYKPESSAWLLRHHIDWDEPVLGTPAKTAV